MYKQVGFFLVFTLGYVGQAFAEPFRIIEADGWFESAYVTWTLFENAERYSVYLCGQNGITQRLEDPLIRTYDGYCRADAIGIKPGHYRFRVIPVMAGVEQEGIMTDSFEVKPHDRSGFAFLHNRIPGAYKEDGTPKEGAVILYITEKNKNTLSLQVTGANSNPCVGLQAILDGFKKGKDSRPLIVRLIGQITDFTYMVGGDLVIENANKAASYITLEGVGADALADGWGIRIKNASNVEIRNLGFMNCDSEEKDDVGLQQENDHIWVHHCDFFYGEAGKDADQVKGDGALDCKRSTYVTFSYNHFWDTGKSSLLGLGENTTNGYFATYHHNWFDHSDSRHPRVRFFSVHVYNNYYDGNAQYGIGATMGSSVFAEANYFRHCPYPMLISMQGSDVFNENTQSNDYKSLPTFSSEDGGLIKAYNNLMTDQHRFVPYGAAGYPQSQIDFDAYVVASREEQIPPSVVTYNGAHSYSHFDTDSSLMYAYQADGPEQARQKVMQYAGRMNGGDFKWSFDNTVDDVSSAVNQSLKKALNDYQTKLVHIQGEAFTAIGKEKVKSTGSIAPVFYMDPSHSFLVIDPSFEKVKMEVFNIKGVCCMKQMIPSHGSSSISITHLPTGQYWMKLNKGNDRYVQAFVKR
jgi:pectate lyase